MKKLRKKSFKDLLPVLAVSLLSYNGPSLAQNELPASPNNSNAASSSQSTTTKPNIIVIMADDIGWFNIGAYHQGMMAGKTPNLDKLAAEGMRFTDYYAEPSCTAGRANFITGQLPIRTGLTTVGQAGADVGMPEQAPTIAAVLKKQGYMTAQFGKNHLGDLNKYLPCLHGFDEFSGYLYHLDAMEDPYWHSYDQSLRDKIGPRNMVRCWATDVDDPTVQPRWGKIGKQKIQDEGALPPSRMETVDDEFLKDTLNFMDKATAEKKPFFIWLNPSRMHMYTHLPEKYRKMMTPENGWYTEEAGMAQLDDLVGAVIKRVEQMNLEKDTLIIFTSDNGTQLFSWPDGGMTPFAGDKGTVFEGGMRVPTIVRWPGHVPAGKIENGVFSGLDWFPTLATIAGDSTIKNALLKGTSLNGKNYKVHLDGYDQTNLLFGKGPSNRNEIFYFTGEKLGAVRIGDYKFRFIDQPGGWSGGTLTLNIPMITNLRLDPFERVIAQAPSYAMDFFGHEFWRLVFVQDEIGKLGMSFVEFPPMQASASFNLEAVKENIRKAMNAARPN